MILTVEGWHHSWSNKIIQRKGDGAIYKRNIFVLKFANIFVTTDGAHTKDVEQT